MPKAYSLDLRERVARFAEAGRSRHAAAAHFQVPVSFAVNPMKAYYTSGQLTPKPKIDPHRAFPLARVAGKDDRHQDDAPARPLPEGSGASLQGSAWAFEDADFHCRPALRRAHARHPRAPEPAHF
jgi:hypothetical protein